MKASVILLFCLMLIPFSSSAATFTVTNTNDSGAGSLRDAIDQANTLAGDDTITIASAGAIRLTSGELVINNNGALAINGADPFQFLILGNNTFRLFNVSEGANLILNGVLVSGGYNAGEGAGIFINGGTVTLTNSRIWGNTAAERGGGIYMNGGALTLIDSTVSSNSANIGGGIYMNSSALTLINSTVSNNVTMISGAGIHINAGTATLTNSTVSQNNVLHSSASTNEGGGISNLSGTVTLTNSTVAENTANRCGGICNYNALGATMNARNTIISNNNSNGNPNLLGSFSAASENNLVETRDPFLDILRKNGGPTETQRLFYSSLAINTGNNCVKTQSCANFNAPVAVTTDQRGILRDPVVDIGSFEFIFNTTAASVSISGRVLAGNRRGLANALIYLTDSSGETRTARTNSFGYYRFNDIAAGQSVTVTIISKRYQFAPQVVNVTEEIKELNFVGVP